MTLERKYIILILPINLNNELLIKLRIKEIFNKKILFTNFFIEINKNILNLFFIESDEITVFESFNIDKLIFKQEDISDVIKNPKRILKFKKNKENYEILFDYIKQCN